MGPSHRPHLQSRHAPERSRRGFLRRCFDGFGTRAHLCVLARPPDTPVAKGRHCPTYRDRWTSTRRRPHAFTPGCESADRCSGNPHCCAQRESLWLHSPTRADHVLEDLEGRIDAVLDGGETAHGLESTVVDASQQPVILYRPGVISLEEIRHVCGQAVQWKPTGTEDRKLTPESMPSPGLEIRHYAPRASLVLIGGVPAEQPAALRRAVDQAISEEKLIGILLPASFLPEALAPSILDKVVVFDWGDWADAPTLAHRLFAGLRQLDAAGVDVIFCPLPPAAGLGVAIQDRLLKAAKS